MTNSLSLKQCHFVGQSSILFPKYIYESFQGLYNPDRIRFLSLIRGSYSYGEGTAGLLKLFEFTGRAIPGTAAQKYSRGLRYELHA